MSDFLEFEIVSKMKFAEIDGITLHYTREGVLTGVPLVFINSLGSDLRIWDGVIPHFADHHPIIRYDKRGHGLSDSPSGPYTIRRHVDDLVSLLQQLPVNKVTVIGISVGGMIAINFAATYPQFVEKLVLCDTGAKIGTADLWNTRISTLREQGMDSIGDTILERWFAPGFAKRSPVEHQGYYNMLTRTPVSGYIATCEAIRDADLRELVPTIQAETLVLCGAEDMSTPPSLSQELVEALSSARLVLIDKAGHLPCIEQPEAMAKEIDQFVQGF